MKKKLHLGAICLLVSFFSNKALALHSGLFLGAGLDGQQLNIEFDRESVGFRGWGVNVEGGLQLELAKNFGTLLSLGFDYSELTNKAHSDSFLEQGVLIRKEAKAGLCWGNANFGAGLSQEDLRARQVDATQGASEANYQGRSQFFFLALNFEHLKTLQTQVETRYYEGSFDRFKSTGYFLLIKMQMLF